MKIIKDLKAFSKNKVKKSIATIVFNPCFHSVCLFRISSFFYKIHLNVLAKIIWYFNRVIYNVDIDYRADIGEGFVIVHGLGIVIGETVIIGKNFKVYQGVTIGGSGKSKKSENGKEIWQPIIGDNVTAYTNSMIFGPIYIKDNTIIKAGQLVKGDIK